MIKSFLIRSISIIVLDLLAVFYVVREWVTAPIRDSLMWFALFSIVFIAIFTVLGFVLNLIMCLFKRSWLTEIIYYVILCLMFILPIFHSGIDSLFLTLFAIILSVILPS